MKHRSVVVLVLVCLAVICGSPKRSYGQAVPSHKPVKVIEFHIDGRPLPPTSWDELWNDADIVVEGIVQSEKALSDLFTAYNIQLVEVYKSDSSVQRGTPTVTVSRMGGVRDKGAYVEKRVEQGFPLFERGEHYVLFLKALENGRYTLSPEGAFLVTPTSVQPRGRSELGRAYDANPELFRLFLRGKGAVR